MRVSDIPHIRLHRQRLTSPQFTEPVDVVKWLGAIQAQDYGGGKWAIAQRMRSATDEAIEKAFAEGAILRTHVLRPTWHFVAPDDIRWMLELTAPRVKASIASYCRANSLDDRAFKQSHKVLAAALRGGRQLTRDALRQAVQRAGMATDGLRLILMLIRAELDGLICSGARIGKQFTYALLDERVPRSKVVTREDALAELARRYFTSRGPATLQDFVWWSGLTTADARAGIESAGQRFAREVIDGRIFWLSSSTQAVARCPRAVYLLPAYDEFLVAYKDRTAVLDPAYSGKATNAIFGPTFVVNGRVAGTWKGTQSGTHGIVSLRPFAPLSVAARRAVVQAARRYGTFLGQPVAVE